MLIRFAQAGFRHAEAVALFALPDVGQVHRIGDHFDPRETLTDQRLSGFDAGAPVVEYDAAQFGVRHFAVEQYDGDILQGDIADNFIGTFAGDDDQSVDALVAETSIRFSSFCGFSSVLPNNTVYLCLYARSSMQRAMSAKNLLEMSDTITPMVFVLPLRSVRAALLAGS